MNPSMKKDCIAWIHGIISFVMLIVSSHSVFQGHSYLTIKSIFLAQFFLVQPFVLDIYACHARVYVVSLCKTSINSKKNYWLTHLAKSWSPTFGCPHSGVFLVPITQFPVYIQHFRDTHILRLSRFFWLSFFLVQMSWTYSSPLKVSFCKTSINSSIAICHIWQRIGSLLLVTLIPE